MKKTKVEYNGVEFEVTEYSELAPEHMRYSAKVGKFDAFGKDELTAARNCALKLMNWALKDN